MRNEAVPCAGVRLRENVPREKSGVPSRAEHRPAGLGDLQPTALCCGHGRLRDCQISNQEFGGHACSRPSLSECARSGAVSGGLWDDGNAINEINNSGCSDTDPRVLTG